MEFFLKPENASIWTEVQTLAQEGNSQKIQAYVMEAQRLTSSQRCMRVAKQPIELEGKTIQPGNYVVMMLVCLKFPQLVIFCTFFLASFSAISRRIELSD